MYFLAYLASLGGSFQFDDFKVIVNNPDVASLSAWWQAMPGIRPLLKLSYALQAGSDASHFRLFNLLVHSLNTCLVALLVKMALVTDNTGTHVYGNTTNWATAIGLPIAAGLTFAVQPALTEAVTYISGRSVSLMALAYLLSLFFWQKATSAGTSGRWQMLASILFFALAMGIRESAFTLPLAALWWSKLIRRHSWSKALKETVWLWLAMGFMLALLLSVPDYQRLLNHSWQIRSMHEQLLGQIHAHAYLLTYSLTGWQINIDPDISSPQQLDIPTILTLLSMMVSISFIWLTRHRYPWLLLAAGWWLIHLLATNSGAARLDLANDRHIYLPMAGIVMALALCWRDSAQKRWLSALWVGLFLFWTIQTTLRNLEYATELSLWQATVRTSPEKARPWNNLGYAYQQAGDMKAARLAYLKALSLDPGYSKARLNLHYLEQPDR